MNETEALVEIGALIKEARLQLGFNKVPFAKFAKIDAKTLASMEKGERRAWPTNLQLVEKALGWREGSMNAVLEHSAAYGPKTLSIAYMQTGAESALADSPRPTAGRTPGRAADLSDEELLLELSRRFMNYKALLDVS